MRTQSIGVGVIGVGVGMAGRVHLDGCRTARTAHDTGLPEMCLVAVDDAQKALARDTAHHYGSTHADAGRGIALRTKFLKPLHDRDPDMVVKLEREGHELD